MGRSEFLLTENESRPVLFARRSFFKAAFVGVANFVHALQTLCMPHKICLGMPFNIVLHNTSVGQIVPVRSFRRSG